MVALLDASYTDALDDDQRWYTYRKLAGTRTVDGWLWFWGVGLREGFWPSTVPHDPEMPRLSVHYGPRLPCTTDYLDLSRAFAALNPQTQYLPADNLAWLAHTPFNRHQTVLWLYYVESWGNRQAREDFAALPAYRRDAWLELLASTASGAAAIEDATGDEEVAKRIPRLRGTGHISRNRAAALRAEAIRSMVDFLA